MTQTLIKMKDLHLRLNSLGLPKKFVRDKILPDWWDDDYEAAPGAVTQAAGYISRRLNLDFNSLLEFEHEPTLKLSSQAKFKTQQGQDIESASIGHCLAARIAELVTYACKPKYQPIDDLPIADIRKELIARQKFVNLVGLLDFCWSRGIPVLHFAEFPKGFPKFDGMVSYFHDRPVIIISRNQKSPAWLLFIAAHELGHIQKKHIENGAIVDEVIELRSEDTEEIEANEVAAELLVGKPDISYDSRRRFFSGEQLASEAQKTSTRDSIDPGVIALNFAWNKANQAQTKHDKSIVWATALKALKIIEGDANAPAIINSYLDRYLDWEKLSQDNQEYLAAMTGLDIRDW